MATTKIYSTLSASGADNKKFTFSCWLKRDVLGGTNRILHSTNAGTTFQYLMFNTSDQLTTYNQYSGSSGGELTTTRKFRDVGAWYNLVWIWDTANAAAGDRQQFWINGVRETDFAGEAQPSLNQAGSVNSGNTTYIGGNDADTQYFSGLMSHINFTGDQVYSASTFGETDSTSGIWKIKTSPSVDYSVNGYFLKMEDSSNLDLDSSGEGRSFTTAGTLTATKDNPSNNFCTGNFLDNYYQQSNFSNGNNTVEITQPGGNHGYCSSTMGVAAGLWYFEAKPTTGTDRAVGFVDIPQPDSSENMGQGGTGSTFCFKHNGQSKQGGSSSAYGSAYSTDDIIGVYLDLTANKAYFSINGTLQNSGTGLSITAADSTTTGYYKPGADSTNGSDTTWQFNFGNGTFGTTLVSSAVADAGGEGQFEYDPSAGTFDGSSKDFRAICTKNIKAYGG